MSWLEKIKDSLTITTGDGEIYSPTWVNASRSKEFNISEFEFVELAGTLADRRKPKGVKYTLEIYFQGETHLEQADKFFKSADNQKYWILKHPFYGSLNVQPFSLNQDNTGYNVSKFTIPVIETITDDNPKTSVNALDSIVNTKLALDEMTENVILELTQSDIAVIEEVTANAFNFTVPIIKLPEEFQKLMNLYSAANAAIDTATSSAMAVMRAVNTLITAPFKFAANVKNRVNALKNQFNSLRNTISNITGLSGKQTYQSLAANIISTVCLTVTEPLDGDFNSNKKVAEILQIVNEMYDSYLQDIDLLQSPNGNSPESFVPDFNTLSTLNDLINQTTSYLFIAVISARKERSIICEDDTNIVTLTHRFYGLDMYDKNIDELIENNDLSIDELIIIPKGRKIIYYI